MPTSFNPQSQMMSAPSAPQQQQSGAPNILQLLFGIGQMLSGMQTAGSSGLFEPRGTAAGRSSRDSWRAQKEEQPTEGGSDYDNPDIMEKFKKDQEQQAIGYVAPEQTMAAHQQQLAQPMVPPLQTMAAGLSPAEAIDILYALSNGQQSASLQRLFMPQQEAPAAPGLRPFSRETNYMSLPGYDRWRNDWSKRSF